MLPHCHVLALPLLLLCSVLNLSQLSVVEVLYASVVLVKDKHGLNLFKSIEAIRRKVLSDVRDLGHLLDLNSK